MIRKSQTLNFDNGFTLLELIVVLAGLGILSSLAIPNYMKYLDYAKVDEAKALLNSTAADCLQGLRRKGEERLISPVNDDVISFTRLKNTGYIFKDGSKRSTDEKFLPNCSTVLITAAQEADRTERLPDLGFTLTANGTLTKIAVDSGSETKFPAESWAGINTTEETELVEWQELNDAITKAKAICEKNRLSFIQSPGVGRTKMWDPIKTSNCTSKPPKFEDPETCTAEGCTKDVWYIDGEFCGYDAEDFEKCQNEKDNALCKAQKDEMVANNATTESIDGDQLSNCDSPVWFFEGVNQGSAEAWKPLMCERNKNNLLNTIHSGPVEYCESSNIYICGGKEHTGDTAIDDYEKCLTNNKDARCTRALNEDALERGKGGPYISPTPPDMTLPVGEDCGERYWYCTESGKIYKGRDAEQKYKADESCINREPLPWYCPWAPAAVECQ
ncbi:MAG: hypothetical protein CMO33_08695 [Verrucomicrobia bacterium]|nr:hypothetical protein [Verrucomicrobiota bacterium]